jgi:uncharacterized protein (TIGR00251 family)
LRETPEGIVLSIRVKPGSKKEGFSLEDNELVVKISDSPIDGKANKGVINAFA